MLLIKWYYLYFNIVYKNPQSTNPPKKQGIGGEFDEKVGAVARLSPPAAAAAAPPEGAKKKSAGKARRPLASPSRTDSPDTGEVAHERQKGSGGPKGRKG